MWQNNTMFCLWIHDYDYVIKHGRKGNINFQVVVTSEGAGCMREIFREG